MNIEEEILKEINETISLEKQYKKIEDIIEKKLILKISKMKNLNSKIILHLLENRTEESLLNIIKYQNISYVIENLYYLKNKINSIELNKILDNKYLNFNDLKEIINYQVRKVEIRLEKNFKKEDNIFNKKIKSILNNFKIINKEFDLTLFKPSLLIIELISKIEDISTKNNVVIELLEQYVSLFENENQNEQVKSVKLKNYILNLIEHYEKIAKNTKDNKLIIDTETIREEILFYISSIINKEKLFKEELIESIKDEYIELDTKLLEIKREILNNKTIEDIKEKLEYISKNLIFNQENKDLVFNISIYFWKNLKEKELPAMVINDYLKILKALKMKNGKYLINFENFYDIKGIYKLLEKKIKTEKNIYKEELKEKIKRKNNLQVNDEFIEDLIKTFSISHSLNNSKKQLKEDMNLTEEIYQLLIKAISKNQINNFKTIENKVHNFISRDIKTPEVLWDDIIGLSKIKEKLKEISILFSLDKNQLEEYKIKKQKGFILYGSPGVGKTMLCEAFAKEIGGIFIYKSMNELISYFKDNEMNGQSKIKFLYENLISSIGENYNNVPIVVFLDEIDSIRARGESAHNNSYYDGITNDFLFAIDQIKNKHNIITIGATNSKDNLDKAMIRNGRLGIQIEIKNNFTKKEVYKFIKKELKNIKNISKKSCKILSDFCFYRDGNEINEILNNFKFKTLIKNKELNKQEIIEIVYETIYEINDFSNISKKDKKETAFHEAGHAFFTKLLNKKNKIHEVTIYPTKKTLGYVKFTNSSSSQTKEDLENQIIILLAGRYSEKIISKSISAGASSDLSMANKIIHKIIMNYGMTKKHFNLAELKGREYKDLSEYQKEKIDKESNLILKNLSNITENLISKNKEKISKIAKKLIKENVIFNKDIEI